MSGLSNLGRFPLYRLMTVPSLKEKYLANMRTIATDSFDWKKIKPVVDQFRNLIEKEIELDTRKLSTLAEFKEALADPPVFKYRQKSGGNQPFSVTPL